MSCKTDFLSFIQCNIVILCSEIYLERGFDSSMHVKEILESPCNLKIELQGNRLLSQTPPLKIALKLQCFLSGCCETSSLFLQVPQSLNRHNLSTMSATRTGQKSHQNPKKHIGRSVESLQAVDTVQPISKCWF